MVVFTTLVTLLEYLRAIRARRRASQESYLTALAQLLRRNNRRYGGYLVHLAVLIMAVGVIASNFFQVERQYLLRPGDSGVLGPYTIVYRGLDDRRTADAEVIAARVDIYRGGELRDSVESYRYFYRNYEDQPTARMGIATIGLDDVYVVLDRWEDDGRASLRVYINPLVIWIWIGAAVFLLGTLTLFWPQPAPATVRVPRTLPGVVSEA